MSRTVIVPKEIHDEVNHLARSLEEEVVGSMLYVPNGNNCPIEYMFLTGAGTPGHVRSDDLRLRILNEFFRRNPRYEHVQFHTHSAGTIRAHGAYYADNFSTGDLRDFEESFARDPNYIHILYTPTNRLVWSNDHSSVIVSSVVPQYYENHGKIKEEMRQIARELGIALPKLTLHSI